MSGESRDELTVVTRVTRDAIGTKCLEGDVLRIIQGGALLPCLKALMYITLDRETS